MKIKKLTVKKLFIIFMLIFMSIFVSRKKKVLKTSLKFFLPSLINCIFLSFEIPCIVTNRSRLVPLLLFLKNNSLCLYKTLVDIVAYDVPGKKYRFCIVYSLLSPIYNTRLNVYIYTNESIWIPSVTSLYKSAS